MRTPTPWRRIPFILSSFAALMVANARADDVQIYDIGSLDSLPAPFDRNKQPTFPASSPESAPPFSVEVDYIVGTDGLTHGVRVVGDVHEEYDAAALRAVEHWHFHPGTKHGQSVATHIRQELFVADDKVVSRHTRMTNIRPKEGEKASPPPFILGDHTVFPLSELRAGRSGRVELQYMVGYGGRARQLAVKEATSSEFAVAAIAAIESVYFFIPDAQGAPLWEMHTAVLDFRPDGSGNVTIRESAKRILRALVEHPNSIVPTKSLDAALKLVGAVNPARPGAFYKGKPPISTIDLSQESILAAMQPRPSDGKSGTAVIEFYVDEDGFAQLPRVVSASEPEFGTAAAQAVSEWHFAPPTQGGKPVVVIAQVPIDFRKS